MIVNYTGMGAVDPVFQTAAEQLLAAAQSAGYTASLSVSGNNPVLNLAGQSILITRTTLDELGRYGLSPGDWVTAKVTGQAPNLTAVARAVSQAEQLAALISAGRQAASGGEQVQADINQLLAYWQDQGTPYNPALVDVSRLNPEQGGWVPTLAETQFYSPALEARNLQQAQSGNTSSSAAAQVTYGQPSPAQVVQTSAGHVEQVINSAAGSEVIPSDWLEQNKWLVVGAAAATAFFFMGRGK